MRRRALLATALLLWGLSGPVRAADPAGAMVLGARMMALMRDAMLWFFSDGGWREGYGGGASPFGYPSTFGASPWSGGFPGYDYGPMPYGAAPYGFSPYSGPAYRAWGAGPLQGAWLTNAGEYLWVRGDRFRLATRHGTLEGRLQVRGNRLRAQLSNGAVQQYRFARQGNLLAMQDPAGQILLLRRIR